MTTDHTEFMVATAKLLAEYISVANLAGLGRESIYAVLANLCSQTVIDECWISDADGEIEYCSIDPQGFRFSSETSYQHQSKPFQALLRGETSIVVQAPQPRELDNRIFQYVGVTGVDKPRIVQIGIAFDLDGLTKFR